MKRESSYTEIFVKVIAWLAVIGGAFGVLSGLICGPLFLLMPNIYANMPNFPPESAAAMGRMMHLEAILVLVLLPFHGAGVAAGVGMLRLRTWGRSLMEGLAWAGLALVAAITGYVLFGLDFSAIFPMPMAPGMDPAAHAQAMAVMNTFMKAASEASALFWGLILGLVLWFLRKAPTRACFKAR